MCDQSVQHDLSFPSLPSRLGRDSARNNDPTTVWPRCEHPGCGAVVAPSREPTLWSQQYRLPARRVRRKLAGFQGRRSFRGESFDSACQILPSSVTLNIGRSAPDKRGNRPSGSHYIIHPFASTSSQGDTLVAVLWSLGIQYKKLEPLRASGKLVHDLRRTAVSNLIHAGVPIQVAKRVSGHKSDSMLNRYAILQTSDIAAAMEQTEAYRAKAAKAEQKKTKLVAMR
jgi:hypothetical protein